MWSSAMIPSEAAAELRRLDNALRVANETAQRCKEVCNATAAHWREDKARLDAEVVALRKDAERYRWLVSRPLDGDDEFYISAQDSKTANADGWWALGGDMDKSQADAYIDAAMKGAANG